MSFEARVTAASGPKSALAPMAMLLPITIVLAAIVQQVVIGVDTDVSWLITVGEKLLDGQRLYVDIFEVNPPASVWIYLPGIVAARALGVTPEFATVSLVFLLGAISLWSSSRLLKSAGLIRPEQVVPLLSGAAFAFLLLAGACFAQREHVALLTLLPFIAVMTVRSKAGEVGRGAALLAGLGAGVTMAIKPHFVLAVAPMILLVMWRRRSIAAGLGAECWAAAAVALAYATAVVLFYPAFLSDALPLLQAVYIPLRNSFAEVWLSPAILLFFVAAGVAVFLLRRFARRSLAALPLIAALGFAAAMGVQGKGYLNHCYPVVALALVALVIALAEHRGDRSERVLGAGASLILAAGAAFLFAQVQSHAELARLIRRVAPAHPGMIVAGSNLSVGHPLTRWVEGKWIGRRGALWATGAAVELMEASTPEQRSDLQRYIDEDRRIFVEDIERGRPDVILVPGEIGRQWIASNPEVRRVMARYRLAGEAEGVGVLVR